MNFTGELVYISNNTSSNIPVRVILRPVSPLMGLLLVDTKNGQMVAKR